MKKKPTSLENLKAEEASLQESSRLSPEEFASRAEALMSQSGGQEGGFFQRLSPLGQQIAISEAKRHKMSLEEAAEDLLAYGM